MTAILVVDDEPQILRALRVGLKAVSYTVLEASSGQEALDLAASAHPEVIILDLVLPDMSGADVSRQLRTWTQAPIIVLSVQEDVASKVEALDAGADDYVTKPFAMPELLARIRVALRRRSDDAPEPVAVTVGDCEVDLARRIVTKAGVEVHLTPTEYGLLRYLATHSNRVVTHGQLLRAVMGGGYEDALGSLRVFVAGIRKKLEDDPANPVLLVTEPGVGYRLKTE